MGSNWRMSEPHAIIGLKHLERLPAMIADRQVTAKVYDRELEPLETLRPLRVPPEGTCNYYKYVVLLKERPARQELKAMLRDRYGVSLAGEVYEEPLHKQPAFASYRRGALPISEDYCARHLCLPIFSGMQESQAHYVVSALRAVIK
jgi:dTDP-4-amino-4,6-dideoxygalactose transaminase